MVSALVIAAVSAALIVGAAWGLYGGLSKRVEGFIVAMAGGALMISAVLELIEPSSRITSFWAVAVAVIAGAACSRRSRSTAFLRILHLGSH